MRPVVLGLAGALLGAGCASAQAPAPVKPAPEGVTGACVTPVYLVVWIDHLDRTKSKAYGDALRSTRIVPRHGGEYVLVSPPIQALEGDWPADRGVVVERYPCVEAARAMWFSDEYQKKLAPLRAGSGDYKVAIFKAYEPPKTPASAR